MGFAEMEMEKGFDAVADEDLPEVDEEESEFGAEEEEGELEEADRFRISNRVAIDDSVYREARGELLKDFDRMCTDLGVEYFAFGKLLVGCIHYADFIPDMANKDIDIGMTRKVFEQAKKLFRRKAEKYDLIFDEFYGKSRYPKLLPRIGRNIIFDTPEIHVRKTIWINLSPFDKAPVPRDYMYGYFRTVRNLNDRYKLLSGNKGVKGVVEMLEKKHRNEDMVLKSYKLLCHAAKKYNNTDSPIYVRTVHSRSERITEEQLYPLTRRKFRDFEILTPADFSPWTVVMDDALRHQITSIQKVDLEILKEFDEICRKIGIGYFVCGGTMLGYMRHGGFIPWDDDIDVGLLRADYNRFLREAPKYLSDKYFLQTRESDPEIPYLFSKIRANNTEYITEYNDGRNFHKGICLDLFPFDFIPNDPDEQKAFKKEVLKKSAKHNKIVNMCIPEPQDGTPENMEDFIYRAERKTHRMLYRIRSLKKSQAAYIEIATRYNSRAKELGLTTVASFVPSYTYIKLEDLLPYQDVEFEGVLTKVPAKPDVFLTMQYGDYMTPPLPHQQVGHPLIRWSVDTTKEEEQ